MIWQFKVAIIASVLLMALWIAGNTFFEVIPRSWYSRLGFCVIALLVIGLISLIGGILAT